MRVDEMGREFPSQPVVGVGAVVLRRDATDAYYEVLLIKRANPPSQGEWSLPGGAVEVGERLEEAVVREVLEETGLDVDVVAQVEVLDHIIRDRPDPNSPEAPVRFHYVLIDFVCRVAGGTLACATDALDACWRPMDQLSEQGAYTLRPKTLAVIRKAMQLFPNVVPGT
jgi:8-oxo-dGTP diphosphatase